MGPKDFEAGPGGAGRDGVGRGLELSARSCACITTSNQLDWAGSSLLPSTSSLRGIMSEGQQKGVGENFKVRMSKIGCGFSCEQLLTASSCKGHRNENI